MGYCYQHQLVQPAKKLYEAANKVENQIVMIERFRFNAGQWWTSVFYIFQNCHSGWLHSTKCSCIWIRCEIWELLAVSTKFLNLYVVVHLRRKFFKMFSSVVMCLLLPTVHWRPLAARNFRLVFIKCNENITNSNSITFYSLYICIFCCFCLHL